MNFGWVTSGSAWIGLLTLSLLQIILGVDNIVLLTLLSSSLPKAERGRAQKLGVLVATVSRLLLLAVITVLARIDKPFAQVGEYPVSVKAILLALGGLFLIGKATQEMYKDVEHDPAAPPAKRSHASMGMVMAQIFVLDIVFSLDQVLSAVGMTPEPVIQVVSVLISVVVMLVFVKKLAKFLEHHPSIRILALSFLVMVGVSLLAEATGFAFPKGYIYFAMAYSVGVEWLNIRRRANAKARAEQQAPPAK